MTDPAGGLAPLAPTPYPGAMMNHRDRATKHFGLPMSALLDGDGREPVRRLMPTRHALLTIHSKGLDVDDVREAFERPDRWTPVTSRPGQIRLLGRGLALVGEWREGKTRDGAPCWVFHLITVYVDGVLTPPRRDQMRTPEGREYAARYAAGLGRTPVAR